MQRLLMEFYDNHETGVMMTILNSDINRLENFFNAEIRQIIRAIVLFSLVGLYLLLKAPLFAPLIIVPMLLIAVTTSRFNKWIEPRYKRVRELVGELNARLSNDLNGMAVIKTFNRYDIESERVDDRSEAYRDEKIRAITIRRVFSLRCSSSSAYVRHRPSVRGSTSSCRWPHCRNLRRVLFVFTRTRMADDSDRVDGQQLSEGESECRTRVWHPGPQPIDRFLGGWHRPGRHRRARRVRGG